MARSEAAKEVIWAGRFLTDPGYRKKNQSVLLYADYQGAIDLTVNPLFHKRTEHIEVRWHWMREALEEWKIVVDYLFTKEMPGGCAGQSHYQHRPFRTLGKC